MKSKGFTLIEILIAMFILTILSMLFVSGLETVSRALSGTEKSADEFRKVEMAFLIMGRDIEQTVERPIQTESDKKEPAFKGTRHGFVFTHLGKTIPGKQLTQNVMQRTQYGFSENKLYRRVWLTLDRAPKTPVSIRILLSDVEDVFFEYIDGNSKEYADWPAESDPKDAIPHGIRVRLKLKDIGALERVYVISPKSNAIKKLEQVS